MLLRLMMWCLGILVVSAIVGLVIYKIAMIIAVAACFLILGFTIGVPTILFAKYHYYKALKESQVNVERERRSTCT